MTLVVGSVCSIDLSQLAWGMVLTADSRQRPAI